MTRPPVAVAEQRWNEQQLAQPLAAPAWRLWRYEAPAVVLGCSQRRLLADAGDDAGDVPMLVRGAGGGAVLTGPWMLGLSVALPADHPLVEAGPVGSYRWLGQCIAQVLQQAGLHGHYAIAPERLRAEPPADGIAWACFGGLSPWEVLSADGCKLAGLAQVRRRHGVLLVGGVLLAASPWPLLCRALAQPDGDAQRLERFTTHCRAQIGAAFDSRAFEAALARALRGCLAPEPCLH